MSEPTGDPPTATVLVCEDEDALRELMRVSLDGGFEVVEAADGREALEVAAAVTPDVVVVDLMLPLRSGIDVLRDLRADERLAHVPVVVVSAFAEREAEALAAGADAFVPKPFDPLELRAQVEELLRR